MMNHISKTNSTSELIVVEYDGANITDNDKNTRSKVLKQMLMNHQYEPSI